MKKSFLERVAEKAHHPSAETIRAEREQAEMKRHDVNANPIPEYHEKAYKEKSKYSLEELKEMDDPIARMILKAAEKASEHPDFSHTRAVKAAERIAEQKRIAEAHHTERVKSIMSKGGGAFKKILRFE